MYIYQLKDLLNAEKEDKAILDSKSVCLKHTDDNEDRSPDRWYTGHNKTIYHIASSSKYTLVYYYQDTYQVVIHLYLNSSGQCVGEVKEFLSSLAEESERSEYGVIDYWFTLFECGGTTYAAFVGRTLNIYEIVHTQYEDTNGSAEFKLVNQMIIAPCCRITITSNDESLAVSINDHYSIKEASNLIYAIPHEVAIDPKKGLPISVEKLPTGLQQYLKARGMSHISNCGIKEKQLY